jgi:glycosyltransferase involved in cell wall biosynthesis
MDISIVIPLYNEEQNVPLLVNRIVEAMRPLKRPFEIIAVDDGSKDGTAAELLALIGKVPELKPLFFRRNFGQTAAMQAGFDHATGDIVVTMDGDLQNDPADIPAMVARLEESGADVISGWRKHRQDHAIKNNLPSHIANWLIAKITGLKLHDLGCNLKAYRADLVREMHIYGELHRFVPAVAIQYGARVEEMVVQHHARQFGVSKYGLDKTIRVALDIIQLLFFQKFLRRPLHFFGYVGLMCLVPGFLSGLYLTLLKFSGENIGGRPLLMLAVLLILMGVQLLGMGVLAEILVRIYHEPAGRRTYTLRATENVARIAKAPAAKPAAKSKGKKKA